MKNKKKKKKRRSRRCDPTICVLFPARPGRGVPQLGLGKAPGVSVGAPVLCSIYILTQAGPPIYYPFYIHTTYHLVLFGKVYTRAIHP